MVDIKGLDKAEVLLALWNGSHAQGMSFLKLPYNNQITVGDTQMLINDRAFFTWKTKKGISLTFSELDNEQINEYIEWLESKPYFSCYFDYVWGHVIKCDIGGDEFDERLYDRDCGEGHAAQVIEKLKQESSIKRGHRSTNDEVLIAEMSLDKYYEYDETVEDNK